MDQDQESQGQADPYHVINPVCRWVRVGLTKHANDDFELVRRHLLGDDGLANVTKTNTGVSATVRWCIHQAAKALRENQQ